MRRIALEISSTGRTGADSLFEKIVELEIIHNLRSDSNGIAGIWADHQSAIPMNNVRLEQLAPQLLTSVIDVVAVRNAGNQAR